MRVQEPNFALHAQIANRQASAASSFRVAVAQSAPVSAAQPVNKQLERFVSGLQKTSKISPQVKKQMIDIAAITDALVNNPSARNAVFKDLAGVAVFIGKNSAVSFPNYPTLTGLRYYDSLKTEVLSQGGAEAISVEEIFAKLEALAQAEAKVSAREAVNTVVASPELAREAAAMVAVDVVVGGGSAAPVAQPASPQEVAGGSAAAGPERTQQNSAQSHSPQAASAASGRGTHIDV